MRKRKNASSVHKITRTDQEEQGYDFLDEHSVVVVKYHLVYERCVTIL